MDRKFYLYGNRCSDFAIFIFCVQSFPSPLFIRPCIYNILTCTHMHMYQSYVNALVNFTSRYI